MRATIRHNLPGKINNGPVAVMFIHFMHLYCHIQRGVRTCVAFLYSVSDSVSDVFCFDERLFRHSIIVSILLKSNFSNHLFAHHG